MSMKIKLFFLGIALGLIPALFLANFLFQKPKVEVLGKTKEAQATATPEPTPTFTPTPTPTPTPKPTPIPTPTATPILITVYTALEIDGFFETYAKQYNLDIGLL